MLTGIAITTGLARAVLAAPDGRFLAPVTGLWCGVFYGLFAGMPLRSGLVGGGIGLAYTAFAPR